jgi:hypothetical protein
MTVKLGRAADAVGVGAAKLLVSLGVLAGGFRAVSDDDYARVVIAQRFVEAPHLDPSGTSWLPLPFWVYGSALRLFGMGLGVARGTAVFLGVLAVLLLLGAARLLGAGRVGAVLGALVAALFPWSAWLGAATVPEAPTAALIVFGMATLATETPRERLFGALALAAACFSRYEAWPIALTFAAFTTYDAARANDAPRANGAAPFDGTVRARGVVLLGIAAVALSSIVLWLLHGTFVHGDTLFFWKRVAGYKHALGGEASFSERLLSTPRSLLDEPVLVIGCIFALLGARLPRYARPALVGVALVLFLATGELSGGAPTHHAGRAVLPLWYLAALALGHAVELRSRELSRRSGAWLGFVAATLGLAWLFRALVPPDFPDRADAVRIGSEARRLAAPALLIDTPDYSYLAVSAAFGAPPSALPLDDHDPRHARPPDAFTSTATLRERWSRHPNAWLVATTPHAETAVSLGHVIARTSSLVLVAPGNGTHDVQRGP